MLKAHHLNCAFSVVFKKTVLKLMALLFIEHVAEYPTLLHPQGTQKALCTKLTAAQLHAAMCMLEGHCCEITPLQC